MNGYKIVKFDIDTEEPVRDTLTGYCIECDIEEPGELLTPISKSTPFAGYKDPEATKKKIGDTFRWKGENCSTTEVSECVSVFPGVSEVNAYGVQIPENQDGRAPMIAITPTNGELKNINLI